MFERRLQQALAEELGESPAVALLGPRQVGKTTLALKLAGNLPSVYVDLESDRDRAKLAHHQGGPLNVAQLARNLSVDAKTAHGYLDLLSGLLLVRRLPPWHANVGKRMVKSSKVYVRDTGLVHALLDVETHDALLSHPVVGASWEAFVIENLLACAGDKAQGYFYRTSGGAEVDLILVWANGDKWAIEIKRNLAPKLERSFYSACDDLAFQRKLVVHPGVE